MRSKLRTTSMTPAAADHRRVLEHLSEHLPVIANWRLAEALLRLGQLKKKDVDQVLVDLEAVALKARPEMIGERDYIWRLATSFVSATLPQVRTGGAS